MLTFEYKAVVKPYQAKAIEEAIRTVQFIRNKCIRYWMDGGKGAGINQNSLSKYSTVLRGEHQFVNDLNSMAVQDKGGACMGCNISLLRELQKQSIWQERLSQVSFMIIAR